ncbi:nephrocystin-3 protein [Ceratobasidium sp. AG-Ba]|nr:nephrocystin-3 protein [Ceratobasidium sp. AG-Ba]
MSNREIKLGGPSLALLTEEFSTLAPTISLGGYCRWMSPELFRDRGEGEEGIERTTASDIWAFGCALYEIISKMVPYSSHVHDAEVVGKIKSGVKPGVTGDIPPGEELSYLWTTIEDCWAAPPENRPGASRLLGKFVQHFATANNVLLARGAATDVWLLRRPEDEVRLPLPEDDHAPVARKCVRLSPQSILHYHGGSISEHTREMIWRNFVQEYTNRIERWRSVEDKNVVDVYEFSELEGLNRQEEYCEFGTARLRPWPEGLTAQSILSPKVINAVRGLRHLHRLEPPVIHGNLSADKLYISGNNEVKLGGFGIAVLVQSFAMVTPTISLAGSCRWMSPELFEGENENTPSLASDIWALGCTIYEIISGNLPYSESVHDVEVVRRIKDGEQPGAAEHILDQELTYLWPIIEECWASAPEKRPPANIVLSKIVRIWYLSQCHRGLADNFR